MIGQCMSRQGLTKPWRVWILFSFCLLIVLGAMAWLSVMALEVERAQAEVARQSDFEETVRLALWRLDSELASFIGEENSRPFFTYRSFYAPNRAYASMFNDGQEAHDLQPSPLMTAKSSNVLLYFQVEPDGGMTSPQVPTGAMRELADPLYLPGSKIEMHAAKLAQVEKLLSEKRAANSNSLPFFRNVDRQVELEYQETEVQQSDDSSKEEQSQEIFDGFSGQVAQQAPKQQLRSSREWAARKKASDKIAFQNATTINQNVMFGCINIFPSAAVDSNLMQPLWVGDSLFLVRNVFVNGTNYMQGCWINWDTLKSSLLSAIKELLPTADLVAVSADLEEKAARRLASLPVELVPGASQDLQIVPMWSIRFPLAIAWSGVLIAALAVGLLLSGAISLSERRGAFVSAVTHELRTPLTTFRLYTDMLAEDMVQDEEKRARYVNTLRTEADRLGHMVENVLAYAKLENGHTNRPLETVSLDELVDRAKQRLSNRAEQANMKLNVEASNEKIHVKADVSTIEQILLNLVDNACKYAATAVDRTIHLTAANSNGHACIEVRDHGPGISPPLANRLFQPFSKSAQEAANSAPGVGLGLALSRRLACAMGGNLELKQGTSDGACFVLSLPVV